MDLYLFPESPVITNGYGIVIDSDYVMLSPTDSDKIIWYTNIIDNPRQSETHINLKRPKKINYKRFKNMLLRNVGSEVNYNELLFLKNMNFDTIFCGDVLFYRSIRKLFPSKPITVRFHNCFSRILNRIRNLKIKIDLKFRIDLLLMNILEQKIFSDKNVKKVFISEEDKAYYNLITGCNDATVWGVEVDIEKGILNSSTLLK